MPTKRSELLFNLLLIPIDALMVFLAFLTSYWLRSQTEILQVVYLWPLENYMLFVAIMVPFWMIIFALAGLYTTRSGRWAEFTRVFLAVSAGIMFFVAWVFLSRTLFFSRLIVIYAWILAIIYVFVGRLLVNQLQKYLFRYGIGIRSVVIIGKTETAELLKNELQQDKDLGYRVVNGLVEPNIEKLRSFLEKHKDIDEIIVADSDIPSSEMLEFLALSEEHAISFRIVPNLFEVRSTNVDVQTLAAVPIIEYRRTALHGWATIVKRILDIILSSLALFFLSPIYVLIAALVKLDSKGPVYYRHKRLGLGKKEFYLYKFRTMKPEYCTGDDYQGRTDKEIFVEDFSSAKLANEFAKQQKLKEDPRVTKLGQFLRKTSLDELPQLFNVFLGQLSLVGPRPIVQDELDKYGIYKHRLFIVKPGVTGLWQVNGRSDMPYKDRVKLDMYYIENWSLWNDLVIMVKTFFVVLFRKNAY